MKKGISLRILELAENFL